MPRPNQTRHALLGYLTWGPMSGYDLKKAIERSISNFWTESYGQIYPILRQLVDEGLATRSDATTEGGRERHVYAITERGRAALEDWLREPIAPRPLRNELLLKLFFAARSSPEQVRSWVEAFRAGEAENRERYSAIRERLEAAPKPAADRAFWLMTLRYGELESDTHLAWCDEVLRDLAAPKQRRRGARHGR